jgi:hypothetical protein
LILLALDFAVDIPLENVGGEALRRSLAIERVSPQVRQVLFAAVEIPLLMRRRLVTEFAVVGGNSKLLDESERGKELRLLKENLRENLLVKKIKTPGAEPNEINEEYRQRDEE